MPTYNRMPMSLADVPTTPTMVLVVPSEESGPSDEKFERKTHINVGAALTRTEAKRKLKIKTSTPVVIEVVLTLTFMVLHFVRAFDTLLPSARRRLVVLTPALSPLWTLCETPTQR